MDVNLYSELVKENERLKRENAELKGRVKRLRKRTKDDDKLIENFCFSYLVLALIVMIANIIIVFNARISYNYNTIIDQHPFISCIIPILLAIIPMVTYYVTMNTKEREIL